MSERAVRDTLGVLQGTTGALPQARRWAAGLSFLRGRRAGLVLLGRDQEGARQHQQRAWDLRACVRVGACVRVCICVCACVRACVRACVLAPVWAQAAFTRSADEAEISGNSFLSRERSTQSFSHARCTDSGT